MSSVTPQFSISCLVPSVVFCLPLPFVLEQVQGFNTLCWSCFIFFIRAETISNKSPWHWRIRANHRFSSMILILSLFLHTSALTSLSHVLYILALFLLPTFSIRMDLDDSLQHKNVIGHYKLLIEFFFFSLKWFPAALLLAHGLNLPIISLLRRRAEKKESHQTFTLINFYHKPHSQSSGRNLVVKESKWGEKTCIPLLVFHKIL